MSTLKNNKTGYSAKDPIDRLIFEKGLRIKNVIIEKDLDLMGIILNNGKILETKISLYPRLKGASEKELKEWQLIGKGIGVSWEKLDEDLSARGFIYAAAIKDMVDYLQASGGDDTKATA